MDRRFIKQVRRFFFFESIFSGVASLSKVFDETENELEDMLKSTEKRNKNKNTSGYNAPRNGKF